MVETMGDDADTEGKAAELALVVQRHVLPNLVRAANAEDLEGEEGIVRRPPGELDTVGNGKRAVSESNGKKSDTLPKTASVVPTRLSRRRWRRCLHISLLVLGVGAMAAMHLMSSAFRKSDRLVKDASLDAGSATSKATWVASEVSAASPLAPAAGEQQPAPVTQVNAQAASAAAAVAAVPVLVPRQAAGEASATTTTSTLVHPRRRRGRRQKKKEKPEEDIEEPRPLSVLETPPEQETPAPPPAPPAPTPADSDPSKEASAAAAGEVIAPIASSIPQALPPAPVPPPKAVHKVLLSQPPRRRAAPRRRGRRRVSRSRTENAHRRRAKMSPSTKTTGVLKLIVGKGHKLKFGRCALVGGSADLLGSEMGEQIDYHDTVIRVNRLPSPKYYEDYGVRTDVLFVKPTAIDGGNYTKQGMMYQRMGGIKENMKLPRFGLCPFDGKPKECPFSGLVLKGSDSFEFHRPWLDRYPAEEPGWKPPASNYGLTYQAERINALGYKLMSGRRPSTGFHAFLTFALICDTLRVYGFTGKGTADGHEMLDQRDYDLVSEYYIMKRLAEDAPSVLITESFNVDADIRNKLTNMSKNSYILGVGGPKGIDGEEAMQMTTTTNANKWQKPQTQVRITTHRKTTTKRTTTTLRRTTTFPPTRPPATTLPANGETTPMDLTTTTTKLDFNTLVHMITPFAYQDQFRKCALVGSSPDLHGKGKGPEIASHDTVIRVNRVPLPEYFGDYGNRTDVMFTGPVFESRGRFTKKGQWYRTMGGDLAICRFTSTHCHWHSLILKGADWAERGLKWERRYPVEHPGWKPPSSTFAIGYQGDDVNRLAYRIVRRGDPMQKPTNGFHAFLTLSLLCGSLDVYGFSGTGTADGHKISKKHSLGYEHSLLGQIADGTLTWSNAQLKKYGHLIERLKAQSPHIRIIKA